MPDYNNGKIYRIVCNETGEQYIGSTTVSLSRRLAEHVNSIKRNWCKSSSIIERGNYEIVLIEDCPCETKEQLHRHERHYIETMVCVNKYIPLRTPKEYYVDNKVEICEYAKQYYHNNRLERREYGKQYHQANKERLNARRKENHSLKKQSIPEL